MKKFITLSILTFAIILNVNAQTAIEKQTVESVSAVLDFAGGTTKGIILPAIESGKLPGTPGNGTVTNGTFLFDKTDQIVKMYQNGAWVNLSGIGDATAIVPYTGTVDNGKQTIIGSRTTGANGVLVLEATDKALILPKVASPHLNVKGPYAGMMCYDTDKKALAVFDGKVWNYWK